MVWFRGQLCSASSFNIYKYCFSRCWLILCNRQTYIGVCGVHTINAHTPIKYHRFGWICFPIWKPFFRHSVETCCCHIMSAAFETMNQVQTAESRRIRRTTPSKISTQHNESQWRNCAYSLSAPAVPSGFHWHGVNACEMDLMTHKSNDVWNYSMKKAACQSQWLRFVGVVLTGTTDSQCALPPQSPRIIAILPELIGLIFAQCSVALGFAWPSTHQTI